MHQRISNPRGFTLIEIMIVVAIIGILAAIAYPSYQEQVRNSQRADAHEALQRIQLQQEKWRVNNPLYTADLTELGVNATSNEGFFTLDITDGSATGFAATATRAKGNDLDCEQMTLIVGQSGVDKTPESCW